MFMSPHLGWISCGFTRSCVVWRVFVLLARMCGVWRASGNTAQPQIIDTAVPVILIVFIFLTS